MDISTSSSTYEHVGWPYVPDSVTTAQMNISYIVAVTIADGEAFVDQFTEQRIRDEKVVDLAQRIKAKPDPEIDAKGEEYRHYLEVNVALKNGQVLHQFSHSAKGSSAHPLTREEIETKFEKLAGKVLPPARVQGIKEMVYSVEKMEDMRLLALALNAGQQLALPIQLLTVARAVKPKRGLARHARPRGRDWGVPKHLSTRSGVSKVGSERQSGLNNIQHRRVRQCPQASSFAGCWRETPSLSCRGLTMPCLPG